MFASWPDARPMVISSLDPYEEWAPSYPPRAHNALMEVEEAAVLAILPAVAGCVALDAGCGTGRYSRVLAERHARQVVGVDRSAAMLRAAHPSCRRVAGDLRALPCRDTSFDVVVSGLALPDICELHRVAAEFSRVLKPHGTVVWSTLHPVGAALGWTRTFDTPYGRRMLPAHWHTLDDHRQACAAAGLVIERVLEPALEAARTRGQENRVALVVRARRLE